MTDTITENVFDQDLDVEEIVGYEENTDDPNRKTHIINPPKNLHIWREGMSSREVVTIARMTGQKVIALCNYSWVPKHDPEKFDICDKCMSIASELMSAAGE